MQSSTFWLTSAALITAVVSLGLVGYAVRLGHRLGFVDAPRPGEVQRVVTPRTGGYAMLAAVWVGVAVSQLLRPDGIALSDQDSWKLAGIVLGSILIVPLAFLDDSRRLAPMPQLLCQLVIATVPVLFGLRFGSLASPFGPAIDLPLWLDAPLTVLWIVGMINAMNLVDVMDGLAGGIAAMAALVLFTRSLWFDQVSIAVLPLILAAAAVGFLPHNSHPARVFMGTCGSVLLGYWLATMSVIGGAKVGTAFVVLAVPILDTAWVIGRRLMRGRSPFRGGDMEHLPQRIHALGLSQLHTVLLLYLISGAFGLLSLTLHSPAEGPSPEKAALIFGIIAVMAAVLGAVTLVSIRQRRQAAPDPERP
jgi:UDP-GlcNAc:undecaprenyl-phosphate/decaprenyl-phosphate GlcNAc-1-phosphate transferase